MGRSKKFLSFVSFLAASAATGVIAYKLPALYQSYTSKKSNGSVVLGQTSDTAGSAAQTHFGLLSFLASPSPTPTPTPVPTPTPIPYSVVLVDKPGERTEGDNAAFTWNVNGPRTVVHTTTVYYGTTGFPGVLSRTVSPASTKYTDSIKDFLQGGYGIPLQFVGNAHFSTPGTYYYRAYVLVDGEHYWSDEATLVIKPLPKYEVKIINHPSEVHAGENISFTWDINGPPGTTGFTTIVGGNQSKPGILDTSVDIPKTPYAVWVKDFTGGTSNIPLRFIGNAKIAEAGTYYFRALAFINGRDIWSDEYSLTVQ